MQKLVNRVQVARPSSLWAHSHGKLLVQIFGGAVIAPVVGGGVHVEIRAAVLAHLFAGLHHVEDLREALSVLTRVSQIKLTLAIRSCGSLNGRRFHAKYSAGMPCRLMMPFSQDAQLTGPTYFLVSMASSSVCILPFPSMTIS